jgi:hypothetical protein
MGDMHFSPSLNELNNQRIPTALHWLLCCRVYLPVFVEGANLSMGDMHFSQGDGEVSFCGAIEMSGFLEIK